MPAGCRRGRCGMGAQFGTAKVKATLDKIATVAYLG